MTVDRDGHEPGIVFMESVEVGKSTLTQHRCWRVSKFRDARLDEVQQKIAKGEPVAVRFLSASEYFAKGGR